VGDVNNLLQLLEKKFGGAAEESGDQDEKFSVIWMASKLLIERAYC
jgi:hypothetical protein